MTPLRHASFQWVSVLTLSSGYFEPASSKSPLVMCRSVQTVFRKSYVSCSSRNHSHGLACKIHTERLHLVGTYLGAQVSWAQDVVNLPWYKECFELRWDVCGSVGYVEIANAQD